MKPTWERDGHRLYLGNCLEVLPTLEVGSVDACVTDPPYGIKFLKGPSGQAGAYRGGDKKAAQASRGNARIAGDDEPFDPSVLLKFDNVLMWGANHYAKRLPDFGRWLAWNKLEYLDPFDSFSDVEFAWHSKGKASRICNYMWKGGLACRKAGENNGRRVHPTQKPVALMIWCIEQAAAGDGDTILDPFMGSGTTGVACVRTGRRFVGIEKQSEYFNIAVRRMEEALAKQAELLPCMEGVA